jgi:predicted HTH transcriptional regulator
MAIPISIKDLLERHKVESERIEYKANPDEIRELFEISSRVPFDDRPNHNARLENLRPAIIMDYLHRVESDLYE